MEAHALDLTSANVRATQLVPRALTQSAIHRVRTARLAVRATDVSVSKAPLEPDAKRGAHVFDSLTSSYLS